MYPVSSYKIEEESMEFIGNQVGKEILFKLFLGLTTEPCVYFLEEVDFKPEKKIGTRVTF